MRKENLGAALFFCGCGILITLICPLEGWLWRMIASSIFILLGLKMCKCF